MKRCLIKYIFQRREMFIDTHCHLETKAFDDLDAVLQRAQSQGVKGFLLPGADPKDLNKAKEIAHNHENIFYAAGVHPYHAREYDKGYIESFLRDEKCIAVGECGMDYYRLPDDMGEKEEEKRVQQECFIAQIQLANKYQKPLIVHIRDASDISKQLLLEYAKIGGVLHCYNASEHLLPLATKGFYFGIGGVVTFKNAKKLIEVLPSIPLEKLLVETDAPYLTPHPHRGKRNEPCYIPLIVEKIAQIKELSYSALESQLQQNTNALFKEFKQFD